MSKENIEKIELMSEDIQKDIILQLKKIAPAAFTEGKIDFRKLREILADEIDDRPERYSFSWAGKRDSLITLREKSQAALKPVRDESIEFDGTRNIFIEGENLEVLKLLYKSYYGRVKMIYIDPPYNTGNDFIYPDNFSDPLDNYLRITGQKDENGNHLTSNTETGGRYHSRWLSMMYPRLFIARQLLKEDGVIFISIDENEVHNLRMLMNEVFGEENFIATIIWQKVYSPKNTAKHFSVDHDYIILYARNSEKWSPILLPRTEEANSRYDNPDNDIRGPWKPGDLTARNYYSEGLYEVISPDGKIYKPSMGNYWRVNKRKFKELDKDNRIWWGENGNSMPALKRFLNEVKPGMIPQTLWKYQDVGHTQDAKKELKSLVDFEYTENVLNTVKPTDLLRRIVNISSNPSNYDIVLDFFAGSSPLGQVILEDNFRNNYNREFILVQLPEPLPKKGGNLKTISDIGKERIRHVIAKLKQEKENTFDFQDRETPEDLGFKVFKLDKSSFMQWDEMAKNITNEEEWFEQMNLFLDPLSEGWKTEEVIFEVALKQGFSLNVRIEKMENIEESDIYRVFDEEKEQLFYINLDDKLDLETYEKLKLKKDDLFICRDVAINDTIAANISLRSRFKTI